MKIDCPGNAQIPQLLQLWKTVFGDHNGFWELFLHNGFTPEHCRCITENQQITAALYWFDCLCNGQKMAYVYAVVTHPAHRNKGLCRKLLEDTETHLRKLGYSAVLLVPEQESLRKMYEKLGYQTCTTVAEFSCTTTNSPISLRAIGASEYGALRRVFLPEGGVIQEQENLTFLAAQAQFYVGTDVLLAAYENDGTLFAMELLGNQASAPGVLAALGCTAGHFRSPGGDKPFAMFRPLQADAAVPKYFGFAFD